MKLQKGVLIAAVLLIGLAGVFLYERAHVSFHDIQEMKEEAMPYRSITMEEASALFEADGSYVIVDVRRADEFASGHIPSAINIPNESIGENCPPELPDRQQLITNSTRQRRRRNTHHRGNIRNSCRHIQIKRFGINPCHRSCRNITLQQLTGPDIRFLRAEIGIARKNQLIAPDLRILKHYCIRCHIEPLKKIQIIRTQNNKTLPSPDRREIKRSLLLLRIISGCLKNAAYLNNSICVYKFTHTYVTTMHFVVKNTLQTEAGPEFVYWYFPVRSLSNTIPYPRTMPSRICDPFLQKYILSFCIGLIAKQVFMPPYS